MQEKGQVILAVDMPLEQTANPTAPMHTSGIIKYATESPCNEFIICTEEGVHYKLVQNNPDKHFYYPKTVPVCPNMKKNTLEKVLHVLKTGKNEVHVSDSLRENSKKPLERMLELGK